MALQKIRVYSKPHCILCDQTYKFLEKAGLEYEKIDITVNEDALDYIISLGYRQAPVIEAGDEKWSGFRPDKIQEIADKQPIEVHTLDSEHSHNFQIISPAVN